ncbi:hypothetical protein DEDE109153_02825 [Deinococcus deserti]|uniref:Uncharacterized protein n=1 Tax=Deinococcus deserti (strain DSM 17065 / CIP 109153 / LMG 22923 / VCD115) TaxID=546414 RepID=C1CUP7_DEIDV|nr:hypothetical protein [Deinococcus deserti]ACO45914.1 hypothetical protein Deide_10310 [Deinococcus deserti VCD115]
MTAVLILIVIFSGIALITYVNNTTQSNRRAAALTRPPRPEALAAASSTGVEALILDLPEPARSRAWGLLCVISDAQRLTNTGADARTGYLLAQTRQAYLPDTLQAYQALTDGARSALDAQGQPPEQLLEEQLALMEDGVREALRHDHAAADRLLAQGRFLRERFGEAGHELRLPATGSRASQD